MPSSHLETSSVSLDGFSGGSLRRHRALPHPRRDCSPEAYPSPPSTGTQGLTLETDLTSPSTSYTSSPRTLKHSSKRIGQPDLPPTPPAHSRQSSNEKPIPAQYLGNVDTAESPTPNTPPNLHSPPTPDFTPPRTRRLSSMRPPLSDRIPSSRTDSFKTAPENPYSSDDEERLTVRAILPSRFPQGAVEERTPDATPKSRNVGLGLDVEFHTQRTPTPILRQKFSFETDEFRQFDGEWDSKEGDPSEVEREWDHNFVRNATVHRRTARKPYIFDNSPSQEVLDDYPLSPTNATKHLREYGLEDGTVDQIRDDSLIETPRGSVRRQLWPGKMAVADTPPTPDVRRFSTMSLKSNSTIIEAVVVIESPRPQRRQTLRHTKKQYELRDFSPQHRVTTQPATNGVTHEVSRQSSNKKATVSEAPQMKHVSVQSNATTSTTSSTKSRRKILAEGSIPVIVIPERRSSMKSAQAPSLRSTSSRRSKKTASLHSAPLSHSAGSNIPGHFDPPTIRQRRMSDSITSSGSQLTIDFPPTIPTRRSSLSAPTSRNVSRTNSLTAESLRAHNAAQAAALPILLFAPPKASPSHNTTTLPLDPPPDPHRLSARATPFSSSSHDTHGTALEISEAQAVPLYPHQNSSVLVVSHPSANLYPSSKPRRIVLPEPTTPIHAQAEAEADSPLRNPRPPPQPPIIKFTPATPASEEDRQLGLSLSSAPSPPREKLSMALLRRALSNRRRHLRLRFSLWDRDWDGADEEEVLGYPTVADQSDTSRLHPFWRPARFWDDLEGEGWFERGYGGEEGRDAGERYGRRRRLSLGQRLRRTFAIVPLRDEDDVREGGSTQRRVIRRSGSGNLRIVRGESRESLRQVGRGWVGLGALRRRVAEGRRERRREGIRRRIGGPRGVRDGVVEVLGGRGVGV